MEAVWFFTGYNITVEINLQDKKNKNNSILKYFRNGLKN